MIKSFKSTLLRWNGWLNRWWKIFISRPTPSVSPQHPSHLDWTINQSKKSDWESREYWIGLRARAFSRIYDPPSRYDLPSRNDLLTAFLNRPSIQLNIHTTENCANTELGWGRGTFSHDSVDSSSELFHEHTTFPIAFLNWPSIQLNIHMAGNYANTELGWKWGFTTFSLTLLSRFKFGALPRTYDLPLKNDLLTAFLNWPSIQLNIHTTKNCDDDDNSLD